MESGGEGGNLALTRLPGDDKVKVLKAMRPADPAHQFAGRNAQHVRLW